MKLILLVLALLKSLPIAAKPVPLPEEQGRALLQTYLTEKPLWTWNWNWGTGILLFGLQRMAERAEDPAVFQKPIHDYHQQRPNGPLRVLWSDQCIPALTALPPSTPSQNALEAWNPSIDKVVRYLKQTKRNKFGSLDHFSPGSPAAWIFPSSIWLDSLVMWGVFALHYGQRYDQELFDFALAQGPIYRQLLWNSKDQFFYHAWNLESDQAYPPENTYWLRGNAWVSVYLIEALSLLDPNDPRYFDLLALFRQLSQSFLNSQRADGLWGTLVQEPEGSYPESSGSALVAYSFAKGKRLGLLGAEYQVAIERAWSGLQQKLRSAGDRLYLGQISRGTNPGSRSDYLKVGVEENLNYGIGAYLLFASEIQANFESAP